MRERPQSPRKPCSHCGLPIPRYWPNGERLTPWQYEQKEYCCKACKCRSQRPDKPQWEPHGCRLPEAEWAAFCRVGVRAP